MNKNKKGKPFTFPDSFIKLLVTSVLHFIYLTDRLEGIINATGKRLLPANPSYGHICKRNNNLTINIKKDKIDDDDDDDLIISIDSTGIKVTNRGQWMDG